MFEETQNRENELYSIPNFKPANISANITIVLSIILLVLDCFRIVIEALFIATNYSVTTLNSHNKVTFETFSYLNEITDISSICIVLLSIITFLIWVYRVYKNLLVLGTTKTQFSPKWAVGCWFTPVINLFRPFQIMREVWNKSEPNINKDIYSSENNKTPILIFWWWLTFILTVAIILADELIYDLINAELQLFSSDNSKLIHNLSFFSVTVTEILSTIFCILVIQAINKRQSERYYNLIGKSNPHLPPSPPTFN